MRRFSRRFFSVIRKRSAKNSSSPRCKDSRIVLARCGIDARFLQEYPSVSRRGVIRDNYFFHRLPC